MNLSRFRRNTDMAHHTLLARINSGDGKFPFVNVQFSKNHRPIPIENATYYLRPSSGEKRTPIRVGKDVGAAYTALIRIENGEQVEAPSSLFSGQRSEIPRQLQRKTLKDAAREYIERSKQKSRKTYLGYRTAVNLFVAACRKTYFDEISRDDMLDFLHELRTSPSRETGRPIGESTVFNYFLKTMVFLSELCLWDSNGDATVQSQIQRRVSQRDRSVSPILSLHKTRSATSLKSAMCASLIPAVARS